MANSIELKDLRNRPFLEAEEGSKYLRPKSAYVSIAIEISAAFQIIYSYERISLNYPLVAPALLGAVSAALAQSVIQFARKKFNSRRVFKFMLWGCINGLFTALWIDMLVTRVENVLYRIILDQTIGAPIFQLMFTVLSGIWENDNLLGSNSRSTYIRSLKYSYCYWPFISASTFTLVPTQMMFFSNCIANFIWNLVLSKLS